MNFEDELMILKSSQIMNFEDEIMIFKVHNSATFFLNKEM